MMDESADFQPSLVDTQSPPLFDTVDINGDRRTNGASDGVAINHQQDNEIFESAVQVSGMLIMTPQHHNKWNKQK